MLHGAIAVTLIVGVVAGYALRHNDIPREARDGFHRALANAGLLEPPLSNRIAKGRDRLQRNPVPVACPDPARERVVVALIAGQSNAANHGAPAQQQPDNPSVVNLLNGQCYLARHPLLGATGVDASPWIDMAERLLEVGAADKVVLIATAIGGTAIVEWAPGGEYHNRLLARISEARSAGLHVTHFVWHQGEAEGWSNGDASHYSRSLHALLASVRIATESPLPAYIALASRCTIHESAAVREAQRAVAKQDPLTFVAVNSDELGYEYRYDGCHFLLSGLKIVGSAYADAIANLTHNKLADRPGAQHSTGSKAD